MNMTLFKWIEKEIARKEKSAKAEGLTREHKAALNGAISELKRVKEYTKTHAVGTPLPLNQLNRSLKPQQPENKFSN
jgi:hypothetical protein